MSDRVSSVGVVGRPWGLLTYTTMNLGDDIQSLAALRFLPEATVLLDRDDLSGSNPPASAAIILNGWWMHHHERLALGACDLDPLLVSMHLTNRAIPVLGNPRVREFLLRRGPVGCRDHATLDQLDRAGIPCWFSGCLTVTLPPTPDLPPAPDPYLLAIDCDPDLLDWLHDRSPVPVRNATQRIAEGMLPMERLRYARARLALIERAAAVVTTRLHVSLPALAYGVPVLLVLPRGYDSRFPGLDRFMHLVPPEGAKQALETRLLAGWPENPPDVWPWARALERTVELWAASRPPTPTIGREAPNVTWDGLTRELLAEVARGSG